MVNYVQMTAFVLMSLPTHSVGWGILKYLKNNQNGLNLIIESLPIFHSFCNHMTFNNNTHCYRNIGALDSWKICATPHFLSHSSVLFSISESLFLHINKTFLEMGCFCRARPNTCRVLFDSAWPHSSLFFPHQIFQPTLPRLRQLFCHISSRLQCLVDPFPQLDYLSCLLPPRHPQIIHPKKLEQTPLPVPESALSQDVRVLPPPHGREPYSTSSTIFYWCCQVYCAHRAAFIFIFSAMTH